MGPTLLAFALLAQAPKPSLTVVVRGASAERVKVPQALPELEVRWAEAPNVASVPAAAPALPEERIAAARRAYVSADFAKCLEQVSDDAALFAALEQGSRAAAARVLLWRTACHVGAGRTEPARRAALLLAQLKLEVPAEVGQVSPEVETVIAGELKQASARKPVLLAVEADVEAVVELDGRPAGCSTPCTLEVLEGQHVVHLNAEGREPATRVVRVEGATTKAGFETTPAAPELAAAQWTARYARASDVDGARSLKLLATAVRASRLVLLDVEEGSSGRQSAVLSIDGAIAARAERLGAAGTEVSGLLHDLLIRGQLLEEAPPLYKRPLFWIAVVGAAALAAGVTAIVVTRRVVATVEFQ